MKWENGKKTNGNIFENIFFENYFIFNIFFLKLELPKTRGGLRDNIRETRKYFSKKFYNTYVFNLDSRKDGIYFF